LITVYSLRLNNRNAPFMSHKARFAICKIQIIDTIQKNILGTLRASQYSEESGIGVIESSLDENLLTITLLKRVSTYVEEYDIQRHEYERRQIYIYQEIHFTMDFDYSILYTTGPNSNMPSVRSFLRFIFGTKLLFSSIEITPYTTYLQLKKSKVKFSIRNLCIDRFNYKDGAIGKYTAEIYDNSIIKELISEYKEEFSKMVFEINMGDEYFFAHVFSNGVFGIISYEDNTGDYFNYIKSILF
jgi:hypothetical protein